MNEEKRILEIIRKNNGFLETKEVVKNKIRKEALKKLLDEKKLERVSRGVYIIPEIFPDEYKLLQLKCRKGIYSYGTALYFWDLSDRVPAVYHLTVAQGYNSKHITKEYDNVVFHYVKPEILALGLTEKQSPFGQTVRVYNPERTICDLLKNKDKIDIQIFSDAINFYFRRKERNIIDLSKYAKILGVEEKLRLYTEVLI